MERSLRSWREILGSVCENQQKKQEIAEQVGFVTVRTIDRWISGQSSPQKSETIKKLAVTSEEMFEALEREFPEVFQFSKQPAIVVERISLPSEFYRRIIHAYAHVPRSSRRWTIFHLVSNQMLPQLDPERAGLMMVYAHCAGSGPNVLTFEEGAGNTFWTTRQMQDTRNAEQWLVQVVAACRPFFVQSCSISHLFPPSSFLHSNLIQSMGFFPLYRSGVAAGGLLLCSTQEDFFTPLRQALIEEYSCLFALALNDGDFEQLAS